MMSYGEPVIVSDADTCSGQPRISGTRITVWVVALMHKAGRTAEDIDKEYGLTPGCAQAAINYEWQPGDVRPYYKKHYF